MIWRIVSSQFISATIERKAGVGDSACYTPGDRPEKRVRSKLGFKCFEAEDYIPDFTRAIGYAQVGNYASVFHYLQRAPGSVFQ